MNTNNNIDALIRKHQALIERNPEYCSAVGFAKQAIACNLALGFEARAARAEKAINERTAARRAAAADRWNTINQIRRIVG
jgi:hypothetical protein